MSRTTSGFPLQRCKGQIGYLAAGILLAGLTATPNAHAGDEEIEEFNVHADTGVILNGAIGRFQVGMRTSDFGASEKRCRTDDTKGCGVVDEHRFTPKNIGNHLCLPSGREHVVTDACLALLNAGRDDGCQKNATNGAVSCGNRVAPYCNYRTEETGFVGWGWRVNETADDMLLIDCSQFGYIGFTPKSAAVEEIATGCLGRGKLRAFAIGDHPLRPCRPHETQIMIPAAVSGLR